MSVLTSVCITNLCTIGMGNENKGLMETADLREYLENVENQVVVTTILSSS